MNFKSLAFILTLCVSTSVVADAIDQQIHLGAREVGKEIINMIDGIAVANPEYQCTELVSAARRSYMAARPSNLDRILTDAQIDQMVRTRTAYTTAQYTGIQSLKTQFFAKVTAFRQTGALETNLARVQVPQANSLQRSCAAMLSSYLAVKPVLASSIRNFVNFRTDRVKRVVYRAKTNVLQSGMLTGAATLKEIAQRGYPTATGGRASCGFSADLLAALQRDEQFLRDDINNDILGWYGLAQVRGLDADIRDVERSVRFDGQLLTGLEIGTTVLMMVTPVGFIGGAARATLSIPIWMINAGRVAQAAATIGTLGYAGFMVHNNITQPSRNARAQIAAITSSDVQSQAGVLRAWAALPAREHVHAHVAEPMDFYINSVAELKRETESLYGTVGLISREIFDLLAWSIQEPDGQHSGLSLCNNQVPSQILTQYLRLYLADPTELPTGDRRALCQDAMNAKMTFQRYLDTPGRAQQRWQYVYALPSASHSISAFEYSLQPNEFELLATAQAGFYEYSDYVSFCAPARLSY